MAIMISELSHKQVKDVSSTELDGLQDGVVALQYPMSMNSSDPQWNGAPVMMFSIYSYNKTNYGQLIRNSKDISAAKFMPSMIAVIMLPMPNNGLRQSISNNIGAGDNTFLQEAIGNGFAAYQSGQGFMDTVKKTGNAVVGTLKAEAQVMAGKATKAYNTQRGAGQTIAGNRGFHAFNGTEPRSFTFNWRFYPKNVAELKTIGNIIQILNESAVPDPMGDPNGYQIQKAPPIVSVQERILGSRQEKLRFTPRFGTGEAQIANLSFNTGGDGLYSTFAGTAGDPTFIDIEITVKELLAPTAEMFRELANPNTNNTLDLTPRRTKGVSNYATTVANALNSKK